MICLFERRYLYVQWCAIETRHLLKMFSLFQPSFQRISGTNDTSFESPNIGRLESAHKLVKVVLFQLRGRGHPQGGAMPNFFPDSKSSILGLSNEVSFVTEYFWKDGENQENIFPL